MSRKPSSTQEEAPRTSRGARSYPRWRHWHVTYHDVGYTLKEAKETLAYEDEHNAHLGPFEITRCDTDHSAKYVAGVGYGPR